MTFSFRDEWINQYLREGYLIFRQILPVTLLRDLRRECDKARALAHEVSGPQAQRIQPVDRYADKLDLKPFKEYCELPVLRDAVTRLLGPTSHGQTHIMGILVEPKDRPWSIGWHRDGLVEVPLEAQDDLLRAKLWEIWYDLTRFNQVNCAIYADSCTWFVPGSHLRQYDLPGEVASTGAGTLEALTNNLSNVEAERINFEHCESFPGAVQIRLQPGDFMVYRNLAWHTGNYVPSQPRATLHDLVISLQPSNWSGWNEAKLAAIERMGKRKAEAASRSGTRSPQSVS
ncbi:MAG: phytanoyl-CoA dioxygenase family protein [Phycisphaeraceae bacterium]|nr:phytanoyl-CoA dioxygenase family protein [Phycisphaeraceae bacterium]